MEMVWVRTLKTDIPGVIIRKFGKGTVIYFPFDLDRTFWEVLCADHAKLMENAVEVAMNGRQPVTVSGPGVLDVTVWRQKSSMTVHLVNLTNPMMMKGPVRELIPVGHQVVRVQIPQGRTVTHVHLLRAGLNPTYEMDADYLVVNVPAILDHEVVAIDLKS